MAIFVKAFSKSLRFGELQAIEALSRLPSSYGSLQGRETREEWPHLGRT